eukprot:SAG31_NODE_1912_length_6935_cov_40.528525_4_plen_85_part_00
MAPFSHCNHEDTTTDNGIGSIELTAAYARDAAGDRSVDQPACGVLASQIVLLSRISSADSFLLQLGLPLVCAWAFLKITSIAEC